MSDKEIVLEPCPRCKSDDRSLMEWSKITFVNIRCNDCGWEGHLAPTRLLAYNLWNQVLKVKGLGAE